MSRILVPETKITMVSIVADAKSMGKTVVDEGGNNTAEKTLKGHLAVFFGGRNAERLILGEHSGGCSEDIARAKSLASYMVHKLAMGEFGVTTEMDLLKEADRTASEVLAENRDELIRIADMLCEKGTVLSEDLDGK